MVNPFGGSPGCRIGGVLERMDALAAFLPPGLQAQRHFLGTYRRTTGAVGQALAEGRFEDAEWVDRWDAAFADRYLDAVDDHLAGRSVPLPWRLAFAAPPQLSALRHVLLGMNAHINYDLPPALLDVISDADFADPAVLAPAPRRPRAHRRRPGLAGRGQGQALSAGRPMRLRDRVRAPVDRRSTVRFLRQSRRNVWHTTVQLQLQLQRAGGAGWGTYAARLDELERLSAARIADLLAPGPILVRLALAGFGVRLPAQA